MEFQIKNAQLVKKADSVQVSDDSTTVTFRGDYAKQIRAEYDKQLQGGAGQWKLSIQLSIEVQEPTGKKLIG